jgi:hypothetical protein
MQLNLLPHPATPPADPEFKVWANVELAAAFGATATPASRFLLPEIQSEERADQLWKTTCFEAFLRADGEEAYREWNFAPSGQWAAYDFTATREGMANADIGAPPYIRVEDNLTWWTLGATVAVEAGKSWNLGVSAVLEEKDGTKSYWALAHPTEKPDFHHPDCFVAQLA